MSEKGKVLKKKKVAEKPTLLTETVVAPAAKKSDKKKA